MERDRRFDDKDISRILKNIDRILLPPDELEKRPLVRGISVDPLIYQDIEQTIHVEGQEEDGWICYVSIIDAASIVRPKSPLDLMAKSGGFSKYHGIGRSDPILPSTLTFNKLSFLEGQLRPANTISFFIPPIGDPEIIAISPTKNRNEKQLSYMQADKLLDNPSRDLSLSNQLRNQRTAAMRLSPYIERKSKNTVTVSMTDSQFIVQNFMTAVNYLVSEYCYDHGIPIVHVVRNIENKISPKELKNLLQEYIEAKDEENIDYLLKDSSILLGMPSYVHQSSVASGQRDWYTQITAPIRNAVALTNWQQIVARFEAKDVPWKADQLAYFADRMNQLQSANRHNFLKRGQGFIDKIRKEKAQKEVNHIREFLGPNNLLVYSEDLKDYALGGALNENLSVDEVMILFSQPKDQQWTALTDILGDHFKRNPKTLQKTVEAAIVAGLSFPIPFTKLVIDAGKNNLIEIDYLQRLALKNSACIQENISVATQLLDTIYTVKPVDEKVLKWIVARLNRNKGYFEDYSFAIFVHAMERNILQPEQLAKIITQISKRNPDSNTIIRTVQKTYAGNGEFKQQFKQYVNTQGSLTANPLIKAVF